MEDDQLISTEEMGLNFESGGSSRVEAQPLDIKCYEAKLRLKLKFFFMNPIEKWNTKRKIPYKFIVQIIKIVLVTIQLCFFAHSRYNHVNYAWDNKIAFSHLFLKGWDANREVDLYPPGLGPLALYTKKDFYSTIDTAIKGYHDLEASIGSYSYANEDNLYVNPTFCSYHYKKGEIYGFNESYSFDSEIIQSCCEVSDATFNNNTGCNDSPVKFPSLVKATISFSLKTINLKAAGPLSPPDCYRFNIMILFNNEGMDGQMLLSLDAEPIRLQCKGDVNYEPDNTIDYILRFMLNLLVILICGISFSLCTRALVRAQHLKQETTNFFRNHYRKELSLEGRWEFWNLWYVMILVNDVLIIIGSCVKEEIERKQFVGDQWDTCSLCLGTGNLLVWFGVLRYFGFFKTYNVIILTLKKAIPNVVRFLICALLIYAGFTFCGWLILGPYHIKFRTLASTSECLFALINGDDMYATFSIMNGKSSMLWWYARVYLYLFISLYIYVVLSLFISIIMDAYETIKLYYREGFPKNDLQTFMTEKADEIFFDLEEIPRNEGSSFKEFMNALCCCKTAIYAALSRSSAKNSRECGAI
ncbi:hypothetical protein GE061_000126 [Apolygus lucorum]|uniref:Uncharacterized protein n=1 Tax=Apolygus lucorum TaxID=248454 RepID=A0A6A4KCY1_APOLU|nr:hypothetical protein GE061_000126 [Apolygus lucorum]